MWWLLVLVFMFGFWLNVNVFLYACRFDGVLFSSFLWVGRLFFLIRGSLFHTHTRTCAQTHVRVHTCMHAWTCAHAYTHTHSATTTKHDSENIQFPCKKYFSHYIAGAWRRFVINWKLAKRVLCSGLFCTKYFKYKIISSFSKCPKLYADSSSSPSLLILW